MKKVLLTFLLSLALFLNFSCSDSEDDAAPTITGFRVIAGGSAQSSITSGSFEAGTALTFEFQVNKTDNDLKKYTVEKAVGSGSYSEIKSENISGDSKTVQYSFTVDDASANTTIKLLFTAYDEDDLTATHEYTITIVSNLYSYDVTLGAHQNTTGSFFCAIGAAGTVYTVSGAKQNSSQVDLVYYWGATNKATLCSPDDSSLDDFNETLQVNEWATKNATRMHTVTAAQYSSVNNTSDITGLYNSSSAVSL